MTELTHVECLVINETLDDAENLEQIYRSLVVRPSSRPCEDSPNGMASADGEGSSSIITLADLAEAVQSLVEQRLLVVRHDPARPPPDDLSYVWRCWFEAGSEARELHRRSHSVGLPSA
jgi:hypothetical protein